MDDIRFEQTVRDAIESGTELSIAFTFDQRYPAVLAKIQQEKSPEQIAAVAVAVQEPKLEAQPIIQPENFDDPENEELRLQIFRLFDKGTTDADVKAALGLNDELIRVARKAHAIDAQQMVDNALNRANESGKQAYDAEFEAKKQFVEKITLKNHWKMPVSREEIEKLYGNLQWLQKEKTKEEQNKLPKIDAFKYPVFPSWIMKGCSTYDGYIKPLCDQNSRYPEMMFVPGMGILLNYLGTKLRIGQLGKPDGAMVNIIGRKGRVMKSSSVQDMFTYYQLAGIVDHHSAGTRNAETMSLVWTAGSTEGVGVSAQRCNCKNMILFFDELKTLSDKAGIEGSSMGGHLLTMLQSGKFANETKSAKGNFSFDPGDYSASVITCCTDRMFTKYWSKLIAFSDGLEDRATLILQPEELKDVSPRVYIAPTTEQITRDKQLISKAVLQKNYEVDDVEQLANFGKKHGPRSMARAQEWALGFAVQLDRTTIDPECIERGIALEEYNIQVKRYLNVREAETKEAVVQNQIIQILMQAGGKIVIHELNKRMRPDRWGTWFWSQCYSGLIKAGITMENGTGVKGDPKTLVLLQVPERDED